MWQTKSIDWPMLRSDTLPAIEKINDPWLETKDVQLWMKRIDKIHPTISGNKWYKLKYNLLKARKQGKGTLLTFGGAFSNHIYATAAAARETGFRSIGIIRGEEHQPLNPTLCFARDQGMLLHYVNRSDYRKKSDHQFISGLHHQFGDFYLLPEGGSNKLAVKGCMEIVEGLEEDYDLITCCAGTGGTIAGVIAGLKSKSYVLGFPVLKGGEFLCRHVRLFLEEFGPGRCNNWELMADYHFGGYAKVKPELVDFINRFKMYLGIPLDPVYTGKMMFGIYDMIEKDKIRKGTKILAIHSGGLQGIEGMRQKYGLL